MAQEVSDIVGVPLNEAVELLEMTGGDIEQAVDLHFSMVTDKTPSGPTEFWNELVCSEPLSEAWTKQGISFSTIHGEETGILQHKNGPCGCLAVIQAMLVAARIKKTEKLEGSYTVTEIENVLFSIIRGCGNDSFVLCSWKHKVDSMNRGVIETICSETELQQTIKKSIKSLVAPGGILLLLLSCIFTRGSSMIKQDIIKGGGEPPLIVGHNNLCSSELVMLFLCGKARGSIAPYGIDGVKSTLFIPSGIGLLSLTEYETGIPVHDSLKFPCLPVWVIHGGDHFTVLYKQENLYVHYNGLPPGGPRFVKMSLGNEKDADRAPDVPPQSFVKPAPGEIDDIVQANPQDKESRPRELEAWRYEVVLAVATTTVSASTEPKHPPRIYAQGQFDETREWRCASCYRSRFKTMCFGQNPAGSAFCQHCFKPAQETGWTLWIPFSELPTKWQFQMNIRHASKIVSLLRTRWPRATPRLEYSSRLEEQGFPSI